MLKPAHWKNISENEYVAYWKFLSKMLSVFQKITLAFDGIFSENIDLIFLKNVLIYLFSKLKDISFHGKSHSLAVWSDLISLVSRLFRKKQTNEKQVVTFTKRLV